MRFTSRMPSGLTWLDTSEADRRRALEVVDLLQLREARDELGISAVRDVLSELLSPGTSTIQTRTRYFLFIPWMYRQVAGRAKSATSLDWWNDELRRREKRLMDALASREQTGVIGRRAGANVKRLPSEIYWSGLGTLGIRTFEGSQESFHRWLESQRGVSQTEEEHRRHEGTPTGWNPHLPKPPADFPESASFSLTIDEALFLREQIRLRGPSSFLSLLADRETPWEETDYPFPWTHPESLAARGELRRVLDHARAFSECMHGAALLYNALLAERLGQTEWTEGYGHDIAEWADAMRARRDALVSWDRADFWSLILRHLPTCSARTRSFIDRWIGLVLEGDPSKLVAAECARTLVRDREVALKGKRSRFLSKVHLEQWRGASAAAALDFRWRITQTVARDVRTAIASAGAENGSPLPPTTGRSRD